MVKAYLMPKLPAKLSWKTQRPVRCSRNASSLTGEYRVTTTVLLRRQDRSNLSIVHKYSRSATHRSITLSIKQVYKMRPAFKVQVTSKDKAIKQVDCQKAWHSCHLDKTHLHSRWCLTIASLIVREPICNSPHKCRDIRLHLLCKELKCKARLVDSKELTIKDKASHSSLNKYHSMVIWQAEWCHMPYIRIQGIRYNLITRKNLCELSSQQIEIFCNRGRARSLVRKLGAASSEEAFYKSSCQRQRLEQHHKQLSILLSATLHKSWITMVKRMAPHISDSNSHRWL